MKARDYLWCALNLVLDREEQLQQLCPDCRSRVEEERCPVCGAPRGSCTGSENAAFDRQRYEKLMRGEKP
ncbi:molybdopterin oxidoreductase [Flavonifractor hominis]|uniref:Molybdopterin oxidoreductase n=1 Tax=Flavonifractor hominis TaxID=3133178 RepID=A0ABV1ERD8_9FIRM